MNQYIQAKKGEFDKAIEFFRKDIATLRTGRANPAIFDGVMVEAYGARTPLNGLANITISDPKSILVSPFDRGIIKNIEKGIIEANLGVGAVNEGERIRVTIPSMTEETRKELVRKLNEKTENARVSLRKIREEIKEEIEAAEKNKEINEDDRFKFTKELDEEVRKRNDEVKNVRDKKEEEVMTI